MEWVDIFAKCFGALVALGTFLKVGPNCMKNCGTVLNLDYGLVVAMR